MKDNLRVRTEGRTISAAAQPGLQLLASAGESSANTQVKAAFVNSTNPIAALYADKKDGVTANNAAFYDYDKSDVPAGKLVVLASDKHNIPY